MSKSRNDTSTSSYGSISSTSSSSSTSSATHLVKAAPAAINIALTSVAAVNTPNSQYGTQPQKDIKALTEQLLSTVKLQTINIAPSLLEAMSLREVFYILQDKNNEEMFKKVKTIVLFDIPKNQAKEFIKAFAGDILFKPIAIEVSISEYERIALKMLVDIDIKGTYGHECPRTKVLSTKVYQQSEELRDIGQLEKVVKNACRDARATDGIDMQYTQALRILSTLDFGESPTKYSDLQLKFKKLYSEQVVKSEIYHLQEANDLHFYMVKVTGENASDWAQFAGNEVTASKNYFTRIDIEASYYPTYSKAKSNASTGIMAFTPSLSYHDQDLTSTYVAFVTNKLWSDKTKIDSQSIEMFVTMMTSEHAHFTTHIGIARAPSYMGKKHDNLAVQLHSFIAKCTQEIYPPNSKEYMITAPTAAMREILLKEFIKQGEATKVYLGHEDTTPSSSTYDSARAKLNERLCEQKKALSEAKLQVPIKVTGGDYEGYASFVLRKDGQILDELTPEKMHGEFAFFCEHPYLLKNTVIDHVDVVLFTCDLSTLASLGSFTGAIDQECSISVIGDALPYGEGTMP